MEDKDFYAFRKSLENEREFEFDENQWTELSRRLSGPKNRRRKFLFGWWLPAAVTVPFLFGNIILFKNLHKTDLLNVQLEKRLAFVEQTRSDTVWKEKIVFVHDTLQNEKIVYKEVYPLQRKYDQIGKMYAASGLAILQGGKIPLELKDFYKETATYSVGDPAEPESVPVERESLTKRITMQLPQIPYLDASYVILPPSNQPEWDMPRFFSVGVKKKRPLLAQIKRVIEPKGFAIEGGGGALFPIEAKDSEVGKGWTTDLSGEVFFSNHLRLKMETSFTQMNLTTNKMDATRGIPFVASPGDDYLFDQARLTQNMLCFSLGVKYLWKLGNRLQPYVYGGYAGASILPYSVVYDFNNAAMESEIQIEKNIKQRLFARDIGVAGLGLACNLGNRWTLQLEGRYMVMPSSNSGFLNNNLACLRSSISYGF